LKLQFTIQPYQTAAVASVVDLFKGQEKKSSTFTLAREDAQGSLFESELGVGNALRIGDEQMLQNMRDIQRRNHLPMTDNLRGRHFCIDMETGTGKTYVFIKSIFEMNRQYGFTKFIIVVPSVAIREGVHKSFEVTREHFQAQYDNVPYHYFIYDSKKLNQVRDFAANDSIEIMIINIDAFRKSENIINQEQDKLNGVAAMRYIQDTNPIVIIDEPQSVDTTGKAKEAVASLNPLCVFRYSATHKERINLMYRLTPVDAYQMGLVKQICVSSNSVLGDFNRPYVRLVSVSHENGFFAKIEIDRAGKAGKVERKIITIKPNADLYILSGERDLYSGCTVAGIDCAPGYEHIEFANGERLMLGKAMGDVDELVLKRAQIRRTIETHLDKEMRLMAKGIKVLSLFFIDEVAKYRAADGSKGVYAEIFEECYAELITLPRYAALRTRFSGDCHDGYFSQDRKGNLKNTRGDTADDYDTYNTIMKDKEWLLSFDCPLRFIFSHSALKEGWDNPNVFQVCTLIEQKSAFTCRQKIGRGLRLCVNQKGERVEDKDINLLHVMANESFAEFAATLQREIEQETGMKFGIFDIGLFAELTLPEAKTISVTITPEQAQEIVEQVTQAPESIILPAELEPVRAAVEAHVQQAEVVDVAALAGVTMTQIVTEERPATQEEIVGLIGHFEQKGYVDKKSHKVKDTLKAALEAGTFDLPAKFEAARDRVESIIKKADSRVPIRDASRDVIVRLNKQVMISPEFQALWDKIKYRTQYRVAVDDEELVRRTAEELRRMPAIPQARVVTATAAINVQRSGVTYSETAVQTTNIRDAQAKLPDFLRMVDEVCFIPQRIYLRILRDSGRVRDFLNNPQRFTELFIETLKSVLHGMEIDGIRYMRLDGREYYVQEIFDSEELIANLDKNAVPVRNSTHDYVIYDSSTVERPFALALDSDPDVKLFFKIPSRFKIETPIGTYNPDWAVYMDKDGAEKLYFVLETKGTTQKRDLRTPEQQKIHCGERHFQALAEGVELRVARDWREFKVGV
jgi:type III restriction enzyme